MHTASYGETGGWSRRWEWLVLFMLIPDPGVSICAGGREKVLCVVAGRRTSGIV